MQNWILTALFCLSICLISAQEADTTLLVEDVTIVSYRTEKKDQVVDGMAQIESLIQGSVVVPRYYGPGSSVVPRIRGGNASQTSVRLFGIPASNQLLGLSDLSLLPRNLISKEEINLQSDAISGTLIVDPNFDWSRKQGLSLGYRTKSYHHHNGYINFLRQINKNTKLKVYSDYLNAKNNFDFEIPETGERRSQTQAEEMSMQSMVSIETKVKADHSLDVNAWYHNHNRQIPPTIRQTTNNQTQEDKVWLGSVGYHINKRKWSLQSRVGVQFQEIFFEDKATTLSNTGTTDRYFLKQEAKLGTDMSGSTTTGYELDFSSGTNGSFGSKQRLSTARLYIGQQHDIKKSQVELRLGINSRIGTDTIHPVGHFKWASRIRENETVTATIQRQWRPPTLNELYWTPGGNPELIAESAWSADITYRHQKPTFFFRSSIYSKYISNYILWLPTDSGLSTALNIDAVLNQGVEIQTTYATSKIRLMSIAMVTYSTPTRDFPSIGLAKGKQLLYVPRGNFKVSGKYLNRYVNISTSVLAQTQTLGINAENSAFAILNLGLSRKLAVNKRGEIQLDLYVENLLDSKYSYIEFRQMPGRNFTFGIKYELQ